MTERNSCYIIAEAGLNHNGSVEIAKKLIDAACDARVDAVKFQKRDVATLATNDVLDAQDGRFPSLGNTYRQIRESLEFSKQEYESLMSYAQSKKLDFICTAFDIPSADFLEDIGVGCIKIASHSITNLPLLEHIASKKKEVIFSTGMCTLDEIAHAIDILTKSGEKLTMLHCVSSYPQQTSESNLGLISVYKQRFGLPVGYSGHENGYLPTLAAVGLGAVMVERHFTLDKGMEGFDHKLSLEPDELACMVRDIREVEKTVGAGTKDISQTEWVTRKKYHVSMVSLEMIPKGTLITKDMVTYKNPGTGILPKDAEKIIGKRATEDIPDDTVIDYSKVSILEEAKAQESDISGIKEVFSLAVMLPVLKEFDPNSMDVLVGELQELDTIEGIFIISELDSAERYCHNSNVCFIRRPESLMPEKATIEDVLQFGLREIEDEGLHPDLILYSDYRFHKRPRGLFKRVIQNIHSKKMDTVFPATEKYTNIWTRNKKDEYVMVGNWLPHERSAPIYLAMNGLGTVTRSSFVRQGRLIGDKVGLVVIKEHYEKQYFNKESSKTTKVN